MGYYPKLKVESSEVRIFDDSWRERVPLSDSILVAVDAGPHF